MLREPVVIYVFSGSGNTHAVAGRVAGTLLDGGIAAQLRPLERSDPGDTLFAGTVGLAFPVALLSTYPFVWEFAENLADGRGRGIFMIDTLAGFSGGIVGPMRRVVSARGYRPVGAVEIRMPSNYARTERENSRDDALRRRGLKKASAFARNLAAGRTSWRSVPLLPEFVKRLGHNPQSRAWKFLRGKYPLAVDVERCSRCGLCAEVCPVSNITMETFPRFGEGCLFCQRCIALCPREAIGVKGRSFVPCRGSSREKMLELAGASRGTGKY